MKSDKLERAYGMSVGDISSVVICHGSLPTKKGINDLPSQQNPGGIRLSIVDQHEVECRAAVVGSFARVSEEGEGRNC